MIRVLLADDHPVVRKGIDMILSADRSIKVVGEATNGGELLMLLEREGADVICLDINMKGLSGLELLPEIKRRFARVPILILSQYSEQQMAVRAIRAGASGYLNKDAAPGELVEAVRSLSKGKKYVTEEVSELLVSTMQAGRKKETLSDRELRVLTMLAGGETVGAIAEQLNLSAKTVSTYRTRVLEKLNLRNNVDLARYAAEKGISLE